MTEGQMLREKRNKLKTKNNFFNKKNITNDKLKNQ